MMHEEAPTRKSYMVTKHRHARVGVALDIPDAPRALTRAF